MANAPRLITAIARMRRSDAILVLSSPPSTPRASFGHGSGCKHDTNDPVRMVENSFEARLLTDDDAELPSVDSVLGKGSRTGAQQVDRRKTLTQGFRSATQVLKDTQNPVATTLGSAVEDLRVTVEQKSTKTRKVADRLQGQGGSHEETRKKSNPSKVQALKLLSVSETDTESSRFFALYPSNQDGTPKPSDHAGGTAAGGDNSRVKNAEVVDGNSSTNSSKDTTDPSHTNKDIKAKDQSKNRKKRKSSSGDDGQTKIRKSKITKPDRSKPGVDTLGEAPTGAADNDADGRPKKAAKKGEANLEPLGLEPAVTRRMDWTPTKKISQKLTPESPGDILPASPNQAVDITMETVLSSFGYQNSSHATVAKLAMGAVAPFTTREGFPRRRKLEVRAFPLQDVNSLTLVAHFSTQIKGR